MKFWEEIITNYFAYMANMLHTPTICYCTPLDILDQPVKNLTPTSYISLLAASLPGWPKAFGS